MPTDPTGPAPEVSAEGRMLIDDFEMAVQARFKGAGEAGQAAADRTLSAYVAGLEAAIARGTEDGDMLRAFRAGWQQRGQFDAAQRGRTTEGRENG